MFEQIEKLVAAIDKFNNSQPYIDAVVVCLVLVAAELAKKYKPDNMKIANKWLTLFVGIFVILVYLFALNSAGELYKSNFPKYVVSYLTANAFYSHLLKYLRKWAKSSDGGEKETSN